METLKELKQEFSFAALARDGVRLGNAAHKLGCNYGNRYKHMIHLAAENGLDPAEYDELVRLWDDADDDWRLNKKSLSF